MDFTVLGAEGKVLGLDASRRMRRQVPEEELLQHCHYGSWGQSQV